MDKLYRKTIVLEIQKIDLPYMSDIYTEYLYKNSSQEFLQSFKIDIHLLHEVLFGHVKIQFYTINKGKRMNLGASKIYFKDCYDNKTLFLQTFDILTVKEIEKANYYNAQWNIVGKITFKFTIYDSTSILNEKPIDESWTENSFVKRVFNLCFTPSKTETFINLFGLFSNIKEGRLLCNFWTIVGVLPADFYYSFLYGKCDKYNCQGNLCIKELCEDKYQYFEYEDAQKIYSYMQEAAASFGNHFFVKHLPIVREKHDVFNSIYRAILERLEINETDIIEYYPGDVDMIGYLIYYKTEKNIKQISISLRGTVNAYDTISDLDAYYIEFQNGYTHQGIKKLADMFIDSVFPRIASIAKENNVDTFFLTGFSLGGALSTLIHLRIIEKYQFKVKTVAFAAPPTFSENIVKKINEKCLDISIYIFENDMLARLSYGSILDLKYLCISISSSVYLINTPNDLSIKIDKIREDIKHNSKYPKLYHPGKLYHIMQFDEKYKVKRVHYTFFSEIIFCRNSIWNHFLHNISNALTYSLKKKK